MRYSRRARSESNRCGRLDVSLVERVDALGVAKRDRFCGSERLAIEGLQAVHDGLEVLPRVDLTRARALLGTRDNALTESAGGASVVSSRHLRNGSRSPLSNASSQVEGQDAGLLMTVLWARSMNQNDGA
jgi:hypothetical protein